MAEEKAPTKTSVETFLHAMILVAITLFLKAFSKEDRLANVCTKNMQGSKPEQDRGARLIRCPNKINNLYSLENSTLLLKNSFQLRLLVSIKQAA